MKAMNIKSSHISLAGKWAAYYILIGLVAGMGSIFFQYLCQLGVHVFLDQMAGSGRSSATASSTTSPWWTKLSV